MLAALLLAFHARKLRENDTTYIYIFSIKRQYIFENYVLDFI